MKYKLTEPSWFFVGALISATSTFAFIGWVLWAVCGKG